MAVFFQELRVLVLLVMEFLNQKKLLNLRDQIKKKIPKYWCVTTKTI